MKKPIVTKAARTFYHKTSWGNILLKGIRGYSGYFASDTGRIFSKCKTRNLNQKTLFLEPNSDYLKVYLSKNGLKKGFYVHNLVGNTFNNRSKMEKFYTHKDKNSLNNCSDNLKVKREISARVTKESAYKLKAEIQMREMVSNMSPENANILLGEYKKFKVGKTYRICYNYLLLYAKGLDV